MTNWFRANKMSVNASKTEYIIFQTHNKPVDPLICNVVYNSSEIGLPDDPAMISPIEIISFSSAESSFNLSGLLFACISFKPHIDMLYSILSKSLYCLKGQCNEICYCGFFMNQFLPSSWVYRQSEKSCFGRLWVEELTYRYCIFLPSSSL